VSGERIFPPCGRQVRQALDTRSNCIFSNRRPRVSFIAMSLRRNCSAAAIAAFGLLLTPAAARCQLPPLPPLLSTPTASATTTATPDATPSSTMLPNATPTFDAEATPVAGGSAAATNVADAMASGGETLDAGHFEVRNTNDRAESVTQVEIEASDPDVLSSLGLTGTVAGSSQTVTIAASGDNVFVFDRGLAIPPGETAEFALSATVASPPAVTTISPATPVPSTTTGTPTTTTTPLPSTTARTATPSPSPTQRLTMGRANRIEIVAAGFVPAPRRMGGDHGSRGFALVLMLLAITTASRTSRRGAAAAFVLLALCALAWLGTFAGCSSEESTAQTVNAISGTSDSGPINFSGVPFSLGSVSRPQPLVFEGGGGVATGSPSPSTTP